MPASIPDYPPAHGLLAGRTVVVTAAAGTGIGFAVAKRCAEEGARILISDIHERRLGEAAERLAEVCGEAPPLLAIHPGGRLAGFGSVPHCSRMTSRPAPLGANTMSPAAESGDTASNHHRRIRIVRAGAHARQPTQCGFVASGLFCSI